MKRKGTVLIQVLMTALVVSIIAAGLLQLALLRTTAIASFEAHGGAGSAPSDAARSSAGPKNKVSCLYDIITAWDKPPGIICCNVPGYTGGGQTTYPGACGCTYTTADGLTKINAAPASDGHCKLSIPDN